jgi:hypothetical protein
MYYLDLLDSTKSANRGGEQLDWWRPDNSTRKKTIALAEASMMYHVLLGRPIRVTNNQLLDSVAMIRIAPKLRKLENLKTPPLFAIYHDPKGELTPSPDSLIEIAKDYFKSKVFISSAWTSIQDRKQICIISKECISKLP